MTNQYPAECYVCLKTCAKGQGQIERSGKGTWQVRHNECASRHYLKLQSEIRTANRASALEQLDQDKRNEQTKAELRADRLVNGHPLHKPLYFPNEDMAADFLRAIQAENVRASNEQINNHE